MAASPEVRRLLLFAGVFALAGLAVGVLVPRLFRLSTGQDVEIITTLKKTEKFGFEQELLGGKLVAKRHHFDRVTVSVQPEARTALAIATLDFDGAFGETAVSSLGVEKVPFVSDGSDWKPAEGFAPRLTGIVSALEQRRRALDRADLAALAHLTGAENPPADAELQRVAALTQRAYTVKAWYIRSERDEVLVTEEYRLVGSTPDRPVDEVGSRRLVLTRNGREFFFSQGLM
jgi:hypothetical protein